MIIAALLPLLLEAAPPLINREAAHSIVARMDCTATGTSFYNDGETMFSFDLKKLHPVVREDAMGGGRHGPAGQPAHASERSAGAHDAEAGREEP